MDKATSKKAKKNLTPVNVIIWDEIDGEAKLYYQDPKGAELYLDRNSSPADLHKAISEALDFDIDDDEMDWEPTQTATLDQATLLVIHDERGHLCTIQIIWLEP